MKFEIKDRITKNLILSFECESMRDCIEAAIKERVDLTRVDLTRAHLSCADLSCADLSGADLSRADLTHANLSRADLRDANLTGAYLTGADLRDANLRGANKIISLGYPDAWAAFAWVKDQVIQVRVGCRDFSLTEGREYWKGKENRREVLAALDYAEKIAKIRGWIPEVNS